MQRRVGRLGKLKPGAVDEYIRLHKNMSAELIEVHKKAGIKNFSIYLYGLELFSYLEAEDWSAAYHYLMTDPLSKAWSERMYALLEEPLPWMELEEVFHID